MLAWPKVTGQRGIQTCIPFGRRSTTPARGSEPLSRAFGAVVPELVSWRDSSMPRGLARLGYTEETISTRRLWAPCCPRASAVRAVRAVRASALPFSGRRVRKGRG
jgi:bifunctional non-homologous end joining protein LigD